MLRRVAPPALLLALGLVSGVLVARLPPDLGTMVVTRRHHGADPLLSAVLLRFGVDSLLHHPSRYFQPPILLPDPNPLRGTEPLVAEALLAVPFRLALGDRPTAVYTWVKIVTLALLTLGTGLMLKELGVRLSLCLLGGGLTVLVSTTVVFADRLQAVSLQWLPLSVLFALRYWRSGRPTQAAAFAVCLFLTVQASLYTTVMLLAVAPFLAPLLLVLRGAANARSRATGLALATAAAAALCLLILRPYVTDRADVAAYSTAAYASEKSWNPASLTDPLTSPPEYGLPGWRLGPASSWDGIYPGTGFVLLVVGLAALGLADAVRARKRPHDAGPFSPSHRASGRLLALLLAGLAGAVTLAALTGAGGGARFAAGAFLWADPRDLVGAPGPVAKARDRRDGARPRRERDRARGIRVPPPQPRQPDLPPHLRGSSSRGDLRPTLVAAGAAAGDAGAQALPPAGGLGGGRRRHAGARASAPGAPARARSRPRGRGPPRRPRGARAGGHPQGLCAAATRAVRAAAPLGSKRRAPRASLRRVGPDRLHPPHALAAVARAAHRRRPDRARPRLVRAGPAGVERVPVGREPAPAAHLGHRQRARREARRRAVVARRRPSPRNGGWRARGSGASFDVLPGSDRDRLGPEPSPDAGTWERPEAPNAGGAAPAVDGSVETAAEIARPEGLPSWRPGTSPRWSSTTAAAASVVSPRACASSASSGDEWLDLTEDAAGDHLRARAANQLLTQRAARLVVRLRPGHVSKLRLVSDDVPWDLPEVRVRVPGPPGSSERFDEKARIRAPAGAGIASPVEGDSAPLADARARLDPLRREVPGGPGRLAGAGGRC